MASHYDIEDAEVTARSTQSGRGVIVAETPLKTDDQRNYGSLLRVKVGDRDMAMRCPQKWSGRAPIGKTVDLTWEAASNFDVNLPREAGLKALNMPSTTTIYNLAAAPLLPPVGVQPGLFGDLKPAF